MAEQQRGRSWRRRVGRTDPSTGDGTTGVADDDVEVVEVVRLDDRQDGEQPPGAPGPDAGTGPAAEGRGGTFASDRSGWPALPGWLQTLLVFVSTAVVVFVVVRLLGTVLA